MEPVVLPKLARLTGRFEMDPACASWNGWKALYFVVWLHIDFIHVCILYIHWVSSIQCAIHVVM